MFIYDFSEWTFQNVFVRLITALVLSCLIGLNRGVKKRGAGAKTSSVVCLASALIMLTAQYMDIAFPGKADMSRMASQVISGVGFLGVGTIIISGHQVKGLTTAASLWSCACIGIATGIGLVDLSIFVTILMLLILHLLPGLERKVYEHSRYCSLYIDLENNMPIPNILELCREEHIEIESFDINHSKNKKDTTSIIATIRIPNVKKTTQYLSMINDIEDVISVEIL